jgi:hypothetical protein
MLRRLSWLAPFFVANQMPLFLYTGNIHIVVAPETYLTFAAATAVAAMLVGAAYGLTRSRIKTVALACGALAWLYWSSAFLRAVGLILDPDLSIPLGVALWTSLGLVYVIVVLRARPHDALVRVWVIVSIAILGMPLFMVGRFLLFHAGHTPRVPPAIELRVSGQAPDIYYLIFDRYAGLETLRRTYGFDNSEILEHLRARGFYVADDSHANYLRTGPSLVSSLNLQHLHEMYPGMAGVSDWRPLYAMLQEHRLWRSLRPVGYRFVNIGSWWEASRRNAHATVNVSFAPLPAFFYNTYEATTLWAMGVSLGGRLEARRVQWQQINQQVQAIAEAGRRPGPLLVFAHLLLPHDPYVFGPHGEFLPADVVERRSLAENYLDHVRFANVVIRRLVDAIVTGAPGRRPIVIIQADEGPFPLRADEGEVRRLAEDWRLASPDDLRQKFGILNALYVPEVPRGVLYPSMTPVNTFRIVFNAYFGAQLALQPDKSFAARNDRAPFNFFEVTESVAR